MSSTSSRRTRLNKSGERRVFWSEAENKMLLDAIGSMHVVRALVRRRQKNADIFKAVEHKMRKKGSLKSWQQIRSRWKRMKSDYIREKRIRERRQLRNSPIKSSSTSEIFFQKMTRVLGEYADCIETCGDAVVDGPSENSEETMGGEEVKVQVELIEGDSIIEQPTGGEGENGQEVVDVETVKDEPLTSPPSSFSPLSEGPREENKTTTDETPSSHKSTNNVNKLKSFADEYARRHSMYVRDWQEQYQEWYERQVESHQQWEEAFMREQMELAKSMLESVTSTFLQGMQQVLQNLVTSVGRRSMVPFCPNISNTFDLSNLNHMDVSSFMDARPSNSTNGIFASKPDGSSER